MQGGTAVSAVQSRVNQDVLLSGVLSAFVHFDLLVVRRVLASLAEVPERVQAKAQPLADPVPVLDDLRYAVHW